MSVFKKKGIKMSDYVILINQILALCGGISIIGGAAAVIWKAVSPAVKANDKIEGLQRKLESNERQVKEIQEMQAMQCQALIAVMDHMITGNHVDKLKETKAELVKKLTEISFDG
jgi:hypothetical protein